MDFFATFKRRIHIPWELRYVLWIQAHLSTEVCSNAQLFATSNHTITPYLAFVERQLINRSRKSVSCKAKIHRCHHKNLPLYSILSQFNPFNVFKVGIFGLHLLPSAQPYLAINSSHFQWEIPAKILAIFLILFFSYRVAFEKPAFRLVDKRGRRSRTLYRKLNKCKLLTG